MVALKDRKEGEWEHSEPDSMGQGPSVSSSTIGASFKQNGFFFTMDKTAYNILGKAEGTGGRWNFQEHLQNHPASLVIRASYYHCGKKLESQDAAEWGPQSHTASAVTCFSLCPTDCLPSHSAHFQILASHDGV